MAGPSISRSLLNNPLGMNTHKSITLCTGEGSACDGAIVAHTSLLEIISAVIVLPIG